MATAQPRLRQIELRGVRVHNLKGIDLDVPLRQLTVITGVSGSGKSSLAFDTLYAEGQRRYIESFSAYARQFLDRLEKPDADRIDHIPPAIAIRQHGNRRSRRSTIATATEIHDYLRLLFAKIGQIVCPDCRTIVQQHTPASVQQVVDTLPESARLQICFPLQVGVKRDLADLLSGLQEDGFTRIISGDRTINLNDESAAALQGEQRILVVVDRLTRGRISTARLADSVELAFAKGGGRCLLLVSGDGDNDSGSELIDAKPWRLTWFSSLLCCDGCGREFTQPVSRLFSFNTPLGACPTCQGFGSVPTISFDRLVPDRQKTLREGAIAPWTTPAYVHELEELAGLADDYGIPMDVPFAELEPAHLQLIREGVPDRNFGGLHGFFAWLERHKFKMHIRVFLSRWRSYEPCPDCRGTRLKEDARAVWVGGKNIAQICRMTVRDAATFCKQLTLDGQLPADASMVAGMIVEQLRARLGYLLEVGLDYLTLDRTMRSLSGGEAQRASLTTALGSSLVNTLYVLDEPSVGLHPRDNHRLIASIRRLRDVGNTVVVVEHDEPFMHQADHIIDIGPGAGHQGGEVVFAGSPAELLQSEGSLTSDYLTGRKRIEIPAAASRRPAERGAVSLTGARLHNLKNIDVDFPLGMLCMVTGVSGSGKSTLVSKTLYPALSRALLQPCTMVSQFDGITGVEQIDEVIQVDQSPIGRSPRSNPVTYLKAFDEIRKSFAATTEAKVRNFTAAQFSFNSARGGRCPNCTGSGVVEIDMQFLPDVLMRCPDCHGTRYRREILDVKYRGATIAEVLSLTVGEAFSFFRGKPKLQRQLKFLKDVGLEYLPLGQPANTLSGGEAQRLKLAAFLASGSKSRTLFLLDEPTTGLHAADVARLLECFRALLDAGHSLIVIEHNLDLIKCADHVIDLGPEAGDAGGEVVATGTPEAISRVRDSVTGKYLLQIGVDMLRKIPHA